MYLLLFLLLLGVCELDDNGRGAPLEEVNKPFVYFWPPDLFTFWSAEMFTSIVCEWCIALIAVIAV